MFLDREYSRSFFHQLNFYLNFIDSPIIFLICWNFMVPAYVISIAKIPHPFIVSISIVVGFSLCDKVDAKSLFSCVISSPSISTKCHPKLVNSSDKGSIFIKTSVTHNLQPISIDNCNKVIRLLSL